MKLFILLLLTFILQEIMCDELICLLGGKLTCEINCLTSTGSFSGHCDESNECICDTQK